MKLLFIFSAPYILDMLHLLFNKMLHSRYFPEQWNLVMIAPLFKSGDQNDTNNYRVISLLSGLGKLFFCTILNQYLSSRIDRARLLSDLQGGFLRCRGCREQISCFCLVFCILQRGVVGTVCFVPLLTLGKRMIQFTILF